jgi:hypothetical protein
MANQASTQRRFASSERKAARLALDPSVGAAYVAKEYLGGPAGALKIEDLVTVVRESIEQVKAGDIGRDQKSARGVCSGWRCSTSTAAQVPRELSGNLVTTLQNCPGFSTVIAAARKATKSGAPKAPAWLEQHLIGKHVDLTAKGVR